MSIDIFRKNALVWSKIVLKTHYTGFRLEASVFR